MQKWDIVEGASGWLRCKALRLRMKEVYYSTRPSLKLIATQQIGYYDTPPIKPGADSIAARWPL